MENYLFLYTAIAFSVPLYLFITRRTLKSAKKDTLPQKTDEEKMVDCLMGNDKPFKLREQLKHASLKDMTDAQIQEYTEQMLKDKMPNSGQVDNRSKCHFYQILHKLNLC